MGIDISRVQWRAECQREDRITTKEKKNKLQYKLNVKLIPTPIIKQMIEINLNHKQYHYKIKVKLFKNKYVL